MEQYPIRKIRNATCEICHGHSVQTMVMGTQADWRGNQEEIHQYICDVCGSTASPRLACLPDFYVVKKIGVDE